MKLVSLSVALLAIPIQTSIAQSADQPTSIAPTTQSQAAPATHSANINGYPSDEELCWEAPEWRDGSPTTQLTQVPHE